jgi:hypothetical protein
MLMVRVESVVHVQVHPVVDMNPCNSDSRTPNRGIGLLSSNPGCIVRFLLRCAMSAHSTDPRPRDAAIPLVSEANLCPAIAALRWERRIHGDKLDLQMRKVYFFFFFFCWLLSPELSFWL